MIFRMLTDRITFDNHLKHYFLFWEGDELLLKATNDADAIKEAKDLLKELDAAS